MIELAYLDLLERELSRIRQYAIEHSLSPDKVADYFSVGIATTHVLLASGGSGADPEASTGP